MDNFQELFTYIISLSIGGVSLATVFGILIYIVKFARNIVKKLKENEQNIEVTKEQIENAFKEAVLPKTIKLDVSSKIEKPIQEGLKTIREDNEESLHDLKEELVLILKILNQFTHVKKLKDEDREKIDDIVNEEVSEEVIL